KAHQIRCWYRGHSHFGPAPYLSDPTARYSARDWSYPGCLFEPHRVVPDLRRICTHLSPAAWRFRDAVLWSRSVLWCWSLRFWNSVESFSDQLGSRNLSHLYFWWTPLTLGWTGRKPGEWYTVRYGD